MQSSRQKILDALAQHLGQTVEWLSQALELSPMTVRHHLTILERDGLVAARTQCSAGPGRPRLFYFLTPAGAERFPNNGVRLGDALLTQMRRQLEPFQLQCIARGAAEQLAAGFCPACEEPAGRFDQLLAFLNTMGYQVDGRMEADLPTRARLTIRHCPYPGLVERHPDLCEIDRALLAHLSTALVERQPGVMPGCCQYRLTWPLAEASPIP